MKHGLATRGAVAARMLQMLVAWAPLLVGVWLCSRADAQTATVATQYLNPETDFRPALSARDIHVIVSVLELKPDEITAVNTLYDGYAAEMAAKGREVTRDMGEAIEKAEVMEDAKLLGPAEKRLEAWKKDSETIKNKFLEDLRSLLTKDQEARWPLVERELRRFKLIGNGHISGESVDLTRVADEVAPRVWDKPEAVQLLEEYAEAFDRALVAREAAAGKYDDWREWTKLVDEDTKKAEAAFQDVLRARRALREVNQRYERQLEGMLSEEEAARLRDAMFEKSFPRLFNKTFGERYIEAASELEGLSAEQREAAKAVREGYAAGLKAWRTKAASALVEYESEDYPRSLLVKLGKIPQDMAQGFDGNSVLPEDHPLRAVRLERYNLDKVSREKMEAVLTAEQRRRVPVQPQATAKFSDYTGDVP